MPLAQGTAERVGVFGTAQPVARLWIADHEIEFTIDTATIGDQHRWELSLLSALHRLPVEIDHRDGAVVALHILTGE